MKNNVNTPCVKVFKLHHLKFLTVDIYQNITEHLLDFKCKWVENGPQVFVCPAVHS